MATLTWQNSAGSLGNYPSTSTLNIQLLALSDDDNSQVSYKLLGGTLPSGTRNNPVTISLSGVLSGVLLSVPEKTSYTFTVRAYDQYGSIRDRTFTLTVDVISPPSLTEQSGRLFSIYDSTWISFQIPYYNPVTTNTITFTHTGGTFPEGLYLLPNGKIQGYATPPTLTSGTPTSIVYSFAITLTSELGNDTNQYTVEIINQQLVKPPNFRTPAVTNSKPTSIISDEDPYYRFYIGSDNIIPTVKANEFFSFKIIGVDFDGEALVYSYSSLPPGLSGDSDTGWITGIPLANSAGLNDYSISVSVAKASKPYITSSTEKYSLKTIYELVDDIVWISPTNIGTIYNNTVSELYVEATSVNSLSYILSSGNLPPNLTLTEQGYISGKVTFEPSSTILRENDEVDFTFTVQVYSVNYPTLRKFKTFTITVRQYYENAIETVYYKASPSIEGRQILSSLLNNTSLIPTEYLYRPDDVYFGKSSNVTVVQSYGIPSSSLTTYINAIQQNYYYKNIVLGSLQTAIARDDSGEIVYEVVYSQIIDDLVNNEGISIPIEIDWPRPISLNLGPYTINNTEIFSSSGLYYTSLSPGSVEILYPNSLDNMRDRLVDNLGQLVDNNLLPKWMTSQQENGNTIGFVKCWVICYTLPGKAEIIKSNIENNWTYSLNEIDFSMDRFYVDKSTTYNYDTNLVIPTWTELPSGISSSTNLDENDLVVLFPRKTILPK